MAGKSVKTLKDPTPERLLEDARSYFEIKQCGPEGRTWLRVKFVDPEEPHENGDNGTPPEEVLDVVADWLHTILIDENVDGLTYVALAREHVKAACGALAARLAHVRHCNGFHSKDEG
jgi:hypothetical protein